MFTLTRSAAALAAAALLATTPVGTPRPAAQEAAPTPAILDAIPFRNFGPFRAGAWITDFAVPAAPERSHRYTFYVGTRNGGLWKTDNGGTTFRSIFDATRQWSIGAVAVAPSDERVVWAGTGESFVVRYSYPGNGVYKSTDAGETWQHMGLGPTRHIARIVIHPSDPNVVYVASMGPLHTEVARPRRLPDARRRTHLGSRSRDRQRGRRHRAGDQPEGPVGALHRRVRQGADGGTPARSRQTAGW